MNPSRLKEIVDRFPDCRIAVLGDFFLDKYLDVDPALAEISVESGKTAHQVVSIRTSPGAAGTIVNNLVSLGVGELHVIGMTGDDGEGYELRRDLQRLGCRIEGLLKIPERFTPTYLKPRDISNPSLFGEHERYDTKNRRPTPIEVQEKIIGHLERLMPRLDGLAVQDQVEEEDCGVITARVREFLAELARRYPEKFFWADSRSKIGLFHDVMIKVNTREAVRQIFPSGVEEEDEEIIIQALAALRQRTGRPVFVTAGQKGIWISDPAPALVRGVKVPEPTDPTGAGDSATAGGLLALCAGASLEEAALLANLVASITVQELATTGTAAPEELAPRLEMWLSQK